MQSLVTIGSTFTAYAEIKVDVPDNASRAEALAAIKRAMDTAEAEGRLVFSNDSASQADVRVVVAEQPALNELVQFTGLDESVEQADTQKQSIKCWYGASCSLLTDEPVPGLDMKPLAANSAAFVGAKYTIASGMSEKVARALAGALGLEMQEGAKPRPYLTERQQKMISTDLWKDLGVQSS